MNERDKWALRETLKTMGVTVVAMAASAAYGLLLAAFINNAWAMLAIVLGTAVIGGGIWGFFYLRRD